MNQSHIRNFSIIAHIDHGKSTLSDRLLERTGTVEMRKMTAQHLDMMDLERERGITIKMQPVRMSYNLQSTNYELNLIDTPGHMDFSYEVSRALAACEGALLLVDATQGVQAQTLAHFHVAEQLGLTMIPVLNKIDVAHADVERVGAELVELGFRKEDILAVSGKTGEGVDALLEAIIHRIPSPSSTSGDLRALVFDSTYDEHGGVIAHVRVVDGQIIPRTRVTLIATEVPFETKEVGIFTPARKKSDVLTQGEIGYVITGLKTPNMLRIGDTIREAKSAAAPLPGYHVPQPVVWASFFPEDQDDFPEMHMALGKLALNDSSLTYQEQSASFLGRGFQCGFLGTLHIEIVAERLRREFGLEFIVTAPSVGYRVTTKAGTEIVSSPHRYPSRADITQAEEPMVRVRIMVPEKDVPSIMKLDRQYELTLEDTGSFSAGRVLIVAVMPLRTFVREFVETLARMTSGFASVSYEHAGWQNAILDRMDIVIAGEAVEALARVVPPEQAERDARAFVDAIAEVIPKEQFEVRIQAHVGGRIIASSRVTPMKKDVTGYLYGGDRTRKMKLWAKQKRGKERLKAHGTVSLSTETFVKLLRK